MTTAAIYARVSSARQREEQTIASQTAALVEYAASAGLEVGSGWVFEDDGHSGATLVRPGLERLRDVVAEVGIDVVLCYSPDRLARKYVYQMLLIEEFARLGTEVRFLKGRKAETPEDALLIQFQGMIAEYERAQIAERTRRGKLHRARGGSVNVLSGAPYGYRYVRKSEVSEARYEIVEPEASVVREVFRLYVEEMVSIGEVARILTRRGIPTATGKAVWDRSTIWGFLRNPAYAGRASFGKAGRVDVRPALTRRVRLAGRRMSQHPAHRDRPCDEWIDVPVPALAVESLTLGVILRSIPSGRSHSAQQLGVTIALAARDALDDGEQYARHHGGHSGEGVGQCAASCAEADPGLDVPCLEVAVKVPDQVDNHSSNASGPP